MTESIRLIRVHRQPYLSLVQAVAGFEVRRRCWDILWFNLNWTHLMSRRTIQDGCKTSLDRSTT